LANVRGHRQGSAKVKTNRVLLHIDMGASNELSLVIMQSFKDGRYSPSTGMEEKVWQIMEEQFIASGVVVKNEIINIDND
jgi:bisphosphoglycerate-independent phosphoglycerate mutase (AlkP superfamily)